MQGKSMKGSHGDHRFDALKNAKLVSLLINCDRFTCCRLCGL